MTNFFDTIWEALDASQEIKLGLRHNPTVTDSPQRKGETVFAESAPTSAFLKRTTPVDFRCSDIISACIDKELADNRIHNGVLSANALSLRNAAFKSKFKHPVEGPKKPPAPKTNKRKRTKSDIGYAGSEITESAHGGSVSGMELDGEDYELEFVGAHVLRPGNANNLLRRVEKNGSGFGGSQNGSPAKKSRHSAVLDSGIQKRTPKSGSKKRYSGRALSDFDNHFQFYPQNSKIKSNNNSSFDEDTDTEVEEFKAEETNDEETTADEDDGLDEDEEGQLFVKEQRYTPKRATPTMTARRVAMLAKDYMKELYAKATSEPLSGQKAILKNALDKVKAARASNLLPAEEVELREAIMAFEDDSDAF